jgi:3-deoxy-D-manno-octulosonate 8-phosphate phosphatase (KDO 8-P phosphatase)
MFLGSEDKRAAFNEVLKKEAVDPSEILYMGDEFFDLPLLKRAGFSATVPSASLEIQESVDYITKKDSGRGCVREVLDMLRYVHGIVQKIEGF